MSRIEELEKVIDIHNRKYWIENNPEISDPDYDKLIQELKSLDPNNIRIIKLVPSSLGRQKIKLPIKMFSLDKVYSVDELYQFLSKIARSPDEMFFLEPKYDGWSSYYDKNFLYTAGDDEYGENITDKLGIMMFELHSQERSIPPYMLDDVQRGEIIIKKEVFKNNRDKLKRKSGQLYKTERSALTGLLSSHDTNYDLGQILTFVKYGIHRMNFTLKDTMKLKWNDILSQTMNWDYPCDGMVIKLADERYSESLGFTSHHPRGQVAFKFKNPSGMSKIISIRWTLGKGNTLNPTAIIEPVIIAGHTINKANLHNAKNIIDINLNIGDEVVVERCGEIIPDIVKVIPGVNRTPIIINECPSCGSPIQYDEPKLYCTNQDCDGSLAKRLTDACVRLGMDNIGKGTIDKMIEIGIEDITDILELTKENVLAMPGFADKSADKLIEELERIHSIEIEDWRLLSSLNIPGIGTTLSRTILQEMNLNEIRNASVEQLQNLDGIGEIRAIDLRVYLDSYTDIINDLLVKLTIKQSKGIISISKGKICFTGKMPEKRSYYEDLSLKHGYEPVGSITKDLAYLVCQDPSSTKGKMQNAHKLGINIITIDQFLKLLP